MRTINLHLVIYEGVRLSGIQRCLVQLILPCWRGEPRGICASCHLPSLPITRSYRACCRQQPRGMRGREGDGRRSERGSRAGLTRWPPTAGAEAATRTASLRKGRRGQRGNKHTSCVCVCVLFLLTRATQTLTSIKPRGDSKNFRPTPLPALFLQSP